MLYDGFHGHGWMVAFRGAGHDRLVSRRWLAYGPWAYLRLEDTDTSIVLFYDDLAEDVETVLAQSRPGHERMGFTETGGYITEAFHGDSYEFAGTYIPAERRHILLVMDRDVSQREMISACAFRRDSQGTDRPIDTISYVFMDEQAARRHLHELWLRGLECRAVVDGREVRLDADYAPTPERPEWARAVEERWAELLRDPPAIIEVDGL